ncbi:spherulin-1B precursor [Aspergillus neoniger CBS 115656]|uniref:Spherulin-1B n=1 Tax=Aspergillus neoniger (strain CBS 115656) TaxID=1448310 RepID=A0A318YUU9_ASPNB|nr:spherulin-1B precursor [Aspergillus neoniger CBS 115656]PYH31658.1 spherulin-1B precursor [Aspergillus neoniger CBS 115656]
MIFSFSLYFDLTIILALVLQARAVPHPVAKRSNSDLSLTAQLRLADTAIERYKLLPNDSDFVFNFTGTEQIPVATSQNWPALVDVGAAISMSQLPACSMSFLHLHPRATELFALNSGHILSEMVPEAGVLDSNNSQRVIRTDLRPGQVTIYPAGSFHTQVNPDCEPANFTAAFTSDEFAVSLVAEQLFSLSDGVIARTFGQSITGDDIEKIRKAIPSDMAIKVEECLTKCGMAKRVHFPCDKIFYTDLNVPSIEALSVYPSGKKSVGGPVNLWDVIANISVSVTNTGGRARAEIPQLYLSYPVSAKQPVRQLRRFERVELARRERSTAQQWAVKGGRLLFGQSDAWSLLL